MMGGSVAIACANAGAAVAWIAPTYKNSRPLWRMAERFIAPVMDRVKLMRSERRIIFPGGGELSVYTADNPTSILGEYFDLVIGDEAARWQEGVWEETILPTLADRDGSAMLLSSPRGRNWFWREWMRGKNKNAGYAAFQAPTTNNPNPNIKRAAELARERVSERTYLQEWLAQFIESGGAVFQKVREAARLGPLEGPESGRRYVAGLDWARTTDFTVLSIWDAQARREVKRLRFNGINYGMQRDRIRAECLRWRVSRILAESNSMGETNNDELRKATTTEPRLPGLPVVDFWTDQSSKAEIIESMAAGFDNGKLSILNDETGIAEYESIESTRSRGGGTSYAAPGSLHDDIVIAGALGYRCCTVGLGVYL